MKTSSLATASTLLAASYAASVTLQTTRCLDASYPYGEQFSIELNAGAIEKNLPTVCGLKIISADSGVNVDSIQCQAFRDAAGTQRGSAVFTFASPALIATNPVQEKSVKCSFDPANPESWVHEEEKRQLLSSVAVPSAVSSVSSLVSSAASASSTLASSSRSLSSIVASSGVSSGVSTLTITSTVGPSSGLPTPSANGTSTLSITPSLKPSASQSGNGNPTPSGNGAAGKTMMGMGVVLGAIVALFA